MDNGKNLENWEQAEVLEEDIMQRAMERLEEAYQKETLTESELLRYLGIRKRE